MARYVLCPYERADRPQGVDDRGVERPYRPGRQLAVVSLLPTPAGGVERFDEAEGLGNYAAVLIHDDADVALAAELPGVLVLPDLPILGGRLSDVVPSTRTEIRDAMLAQGWTAKAIRDALGPDPATWTLRQALAFMCSRRRKVRADANGEIVLDGADQWVKPLPLPRIAGGAFPTTGVLDYFARPDGTTPPGPSWSHDAGINSVGLHTISHKFAATGGSGSGTAYWNLTDYGPDCEAYYTIDSIVADVYYGFGLRIVQLTGGETFDGYDLAYKHSATITAWISRVDNGVSTTLGATIGTAFASGDSIGFEVIGSTINYYRKPAAGAWGSLANRTDGTHTAAGKIYIWSVGGSSASDNFGGGTVWAGPAPPTPGAVASVFTGTTVTAVLPAHATNDILIVQGWRNDAGDLTCGTGGWALIGTASNDANLSTAWFWKRAASGAETNPVVTSSTAATATAGLYARAWEVTGCVTSGDPFEDATFSGPTSSTTPASSAIDTTAANEIALSLMAGDASTDWTTTTQPAPVNWYPVGDDPAVGSAPTVTAGTIAAIASGTTLTVTLPTHATNDILIVAGSFNVASTLTCGTAGWAAVTGAAAQSNANMSSCWFWKRAASGAETNPVITSSATASATQGIYGTAFAVSGCVASGDPFEGVDLAGSPSLGTQPFTNGGVNGATLGPNRLMLAIAVIDDNNAISSGYPPATWSTCVDTGSDTGGDGKCLAIKKVVAAQTPNHGPGVLLGTQAASDYWKVMQISFIPLGVGRSTAILKNVPAAGAVGSATVGTLSGAAYWRTLTLALGTPVSAATTPVFPTMAPLGAA